MAEGSCNCPAGAFALMHVGFCSKENNQMIREPKEKDYDEKASSLI